MARLGYDRYVAQGGDWGAMVTNQIGLRDTEHCAGIHLNMPIVAPDPETMSDLTPLEQRALAGMQRYQDFDSGYSKQQSTRPQSLGYGLVDSPPGPRAWATAWWIRPAARRPGFSRNSGRGWIATATPRTCSPGMNSWIT